MDIDLDKVVDGALMGDVDAMQLLGYRYYNGIGFEKNLELAASWTRMASDRGCAWADISLGMLYLYGDGVEKSYREAVRLFKRSSKELPQAAMQLGYMYMEGAGVRKNHRKAFRYFSKAANDSLKYQTAVHSIYCVGYCYHNGFGINLNVGKAVRYYKKAASLGDNVALVTLAKMYHDGEFVEQDLNKAIMYLEQGAAVGDLYSKIYLSYYYYEQSEKDSDHENAFRLAAQLAESGNYVGQMMLCGFYEQGIGTEENERLSHYWYETAQQNKVKTLDVPFGVKKSDMGF
jgi:uncharacterized protein